MKKTTRRRTRIDIETHEITVIRAKGDRKNQYCEICGENVSAIDLARLAEILRKSTGELRGRIRENKLHLITTGVDGELICGNSLGTKTLS